jgi:hypothetical protein
MGMFDSLYVGCPCGESVEFQSKAGDCHCDNFTLADCPPAIAADLIGETRKCRSCGKEMRLRGSVTLFPEYFPGRVPGYGE